MRLSYMIALIVLTSACADPSGTARLEILERAPSSALWQAQRTTSDPSELRRVEFELARRGETSYLGSYIGQRSARTVGTQVYQRTAMPAQTTSENRFNCSDFPNAISAQRAFIQAGGPNSDPNDLDRDGDGFACEWGADFKAISNRARPRPVATPRPARVSAPRCYTGPRGGRYTISSSGARNYNGC